MHEYCISPPCAWQEPKIKLESRTVAIWKNDRYVNVLANICPACHQTYIDENQTKDTRHLLNE